jgi:small-conductance mechanosensitive channel
VGVGDPEVIPSLAGLLGAASGFIVVLAARRGLGRRPSAAAQALARDLLAVERVLGLYVVARGLQLSGVAARPEAAHGLRFCVELLGAIAVARLASALAFFASAHLRKKTASLIVRSFAAWGATFAVSAAALRLEYQIDLSSLLATSALLSVVLGFALQETLGNLFAGLTLNAEHPFDPGEWVTFGKYTGRVLDVGWRSTRLVNAEGDEMLVPNSLISREVVVNHMRPQHAHALDLTVSIDLDTSPARAKAVLLEAARSCPLVLAQPEPRVHLAAFTPDGASYRLVVHAQNFAQRRQVLDQVQEAIWYALRRAAIEMPYPQTTLSFRERAADAEERRRREHLAEAEDLLSRVDFVQALGEDARKLLAERARYLEYGPGQAVVRQGEQGDALFLVASGEVRVRVMPAGGGTEKEVARLGRGALFGEMSVLTGDARTATVVAAGDAALLSIDREAFERVLSREPSLAQRLAEVIAHRRLGLDAAHAEADAPGMASEASNLLGRIRAIFGFGRRAG